MSFGADLWHGSIDSGFVPAILTLKRSLKDQVKVVESYADHGTQFMEKANDFMKQAAQLEADYAKALQKLAKQHKDEVARKLNDKTNATFNKAVLGSTLSQSWMAILTETEAIASYHIERAEKIDTDIRKSIKHKGKDNEKSNRQHFADIQKANADLRKVIDNLEKMQQKYEKAMKDMDMARVALENASKDPNSTKKMIDQLKADSDKKAAAAQEVGSQYKSCMAESNVAKNKHFRETIPSILD
eukprot:jgi/Hompol1/4841/HPOL_003935-RA